MGDEHLQALKRLCRVCGNLLTKKSFLVSSYADKLKKTFNLITTNDNPTTHPNQFCNKCYMKEHHLSNSSGYTRIVQLATYSWLTHEDKCQICDHFADLTKGGIKTKSSAKGRPSLDNEKFWTKQKTEDLKKNLMPDLIHCQDDFDNNYNRQLKLCKCNLCACVIRVPMRIK